MFLNLQISAILIVFLSRMESLLLKYDMRILFSGNVSGFRISPRFSGFFSNFQIFSILTMFFFFLQKVWCHKIYDDFGYDEVYSDFCIFRKLLIF